jgi:hypothetical protein
MAAFFWLAMYIEPESDIKELKVLKSSFFSCFE